MKNIKGFAVASDGNMKRIAITFDEIRLVDKMPEEPEKPNAPRYVDNTGKVINSNVKMNRIITDENVLAAVSTLEQYGQIVIDE